MGSQDAPAITGAWDWYKSEGKWISRTKQIGIIKPNVVDYYIRIITGDTYHLVPRLRDPRDPNDQDTGYDIVKK